MAPFPATASSLVSASYPSSQAKHQPLPPPRRQLYACTRVNLGRRPPATVGDRCSHSKGLGHLRSLGPLLRLPWGPRPRATPPPPQRLAPSSAQKSSGALSLADAARHGADRVSGSVHKLHFRRGLRTGRWTGVGGLEHRGLPPGRVWPAPAGYNGSTAGATCWDFALTSFKFGSERD